MSRLRASLLALVTAALATSPGWAAQELPVDLRPEVEARLKAERTMKSLLDEWTANAFDVRFKANPEYTTEAFRASRVRLEGLSIAFTADWYRRYKAFHDAVVKQPWGADTLRHGLQYCRQGDGRLVATMFDAKGQAVWSRPITGTRAPSHYPPVEMHLFDATVKRPLPARPPDLRQLWSLPRGEAPYVEMPLRLVGAVKKIRVGDLGPDRKWPVELGDPFATPPPPPPPPVPPAGSGGSPGPGRSPGPVPSGSAPRLAPPSLGPSGAPSATPTPRGGSRPAASARPLPTASPSP